MPLSQSLGDEAVDNPGHGGPRNAFRGREGAQRAGAAKDEHRERRKPGGSQARFPVDFTEAAQHVDRARVQCRCGNSQVRLACTHDFCIASLREFT
jgi:hypothetical protein